MTKEQENYHDILTQRFFTLRTSLWAILFTFNGIIFAIYKIFDVMVSFFPIVLSAIISIISMLVIVFFFKLCIRDTTNWYILNFITDDKEKEKKNAETERKSDRFRNIMNTLENCVIVAFIIQLLILVIFLAGNWNDC